VNHVKDEDLIFKLTDGLLYIRLLNFISEEVNISEDDIFSGIISLTLLTMNPSIALESGLMILI
jgi:hypothetical protein